MQQFSYKKKSSRQYKSKIVAIPAYNEAQTIGNVVKNSLMFADKVVVCDDGSTDDTAKIAKQNGAVVISHPKNNGYGAALLTLFEAARQENADVMITIDGDGQHDPNQIPDMLDALEEHKLDVIIGSRFLNENSNVPSIRKSGIKMITSASNFGTKFKVTDSQSGFRAYSKNAIEKINLTEKGMSASTEILQKISNHDLTVAEIPITVKYFEKSSSKRTWPHGIQVLMNTLKIISVKHPILSYGIPGIIILITGMILGFNFLDNYLNTNEIFLGSLFGSLVLILIGVVLIATSIILFSLATLMHERK